MPVIATFAAASARGFGTEAYEVVPGTTTFTSSGTFTIPNYNTMTVSARGGAGGKGGSTTYLGGPGTCHYGTSGVDGGNSSAIGGGISRTSTGGNGGNRGACSSGGSGNNCNTGSNGGSSTATSTTYGVGVLTIGASVTVTVGQGGSGGNNSGVSPCPSGKAASGANTGYVTFTWS